MSIIGHNEYTYKGIYMNSGLLSLISALLGSIIGSLVTGYFTLRATKNEFNNQRTILNESNTILRRTILQSIHDEIEAIYKRYRVTIGNKISTLEDNEPLLQYYPISDDFFMFYRANTIEIGKLEDNNLRKLIIETYILAKSLIDSLKINNNFLEQYEKANHLLIQFQQASAISLNTSKTDTLNSQQEVLENSVELTLKQLESYSKNLKKIHFEFEYKVKKLLRELHKLGVLKEN